MEPHEEVISLGRPRLQGGPPLPGVSSDDKCGLRTLFERKHGHRFEDFLLVYTNATAVTDGVVKT